MEINDLIKLYSNHTVVKNLANVLSNPQNSQKRFFADGIKASALSLIASSFYLSINKTIILIVNDKEEAAYLYNDLLKLFDEQQISFYPSSYKRSLVYSKEHKTDSSGMIMRTDALNRLRSSKPSILVSYPESFIEKVISTKNLEKNTLELNVGEQISIDFIVEVLHEYHFHRVDFVYEPGQFSVRGSIVDIFSFSADLPFRVDFFGEEVESIRTFNVFTQLSVSKFNQIAIIPNIQKLRDVTRESFFNFCPANSLVIIKDYLFSIDRVKQVYSKTYENPPLDELGITITPSEYFCDDNEVITGLNKFQAIELSKSKYSTCNDTFTFNISHQPSFQKNFNLVVENLEDKQQKGYTNFILSENQKQFERLHSIFESEEFKGRVKFTNVLHVLHEGFIDHDLKVCCYTDHQIFERFHKFQLKDRSMSEGKEALTLRELNDLQPGDYVVHVDHGIGKFAGLQKIEVDGKTQETIRLTYRDNDVLFVSIHSLHRISKYKGKDGEPPTIHKLGSGVWQKLKEKTKKNVKDIAKELIELYAKRKAETGFAFSPDSYLQDELESSFIYEDTPDQVKATLDFKRDMESEMPMDRLICGDVGFGKTEVAIRAAFKAVADSKQVAILVPTTILALQHYHTFSERLKGLPCRVEYISRLKKPADVKVVLNDLQAGKVDILIGTHKLTGKEVKFKDLGLLIVDEEQKFGVAIKDKLKAIKVSVDTLTLTATPIPRTLQFSLMGARDLSVINTPPPNRFPIVTEVHTFNEDVIREAINFEIDRGGQVFFIHNRVQNIFEIETLINRLCPSVRTIAAHGQMEGSKLEKIMIDFIEGVYGVLIATTIIESGLDIPNANTIIINNAHMFGLSDLHQLRGRVGRSNKKAFAYLLAPPKTTLTQEARRRLEAIENFSELGSGFNIALQDLDIRGAGNLLGGEQSGFIADIGFETYQRILDEALFELKENDYKELFNNQEVNVNTEIKFVPDCHIDTDFELVFPENYIENATERIKLYRELDNLETEEELEKYTTQLCDRFGKLPRQALDLIETLRVRWMAIRMGIEKIILKNQKLICYFVSNQNSPFYQSPIWPMVLKYLQNNSKKCQMKEQNNKLSLTIDDVKDIHAVKQIFNKVMEVKKN